MLDTPMEKFVSYYQIDEMSESDENDFEEDGMTMRSSPRVNQMQIFNRDVDTESLVIASEEGDMKLNESFEAAADHHNSRNNLARAHTIAGETEPRTLQRTYPA